MLKSVYEKMLSEFWATFFYDYKINLLWFFDSVEVVAKHQTLRYI